MLNNDFNITIGEVVSIDDEYSGGRIRAMINGDKYKDTIPYAYPLLPYMVHVLPKIGEAVLILFSNKEKTKSQRFFIGPIIHQPQFVNKDDIRSAISFLKGEKNNILNSHVRNPETHGAYPKQDEIAILGRKDSDLIFSDDDVRLRCGVHLSEKGNNLNSIFNKQTPSFIKLKYHDKKFSNNTNTTATIVSENINLLSTVGNPEFKLSDINESISDEEMNKIIENAHQLPYGDILINFIKIFLKAFNSHTHNYNNLPPVKDSNFISLNNFKLQDILSKNIKIN